MYDLKMPYYRALSSQVRGVLSPLLRAKAFAGRTVALDFDNCCIANDIGESCFETLVQSETITRAALPADLQTVLGRGVGDDLLKFYIEFCTEADGQPEATEAIDRWLAQICQGLTPWDLVKATELTLARSHRRCRFAKPFAHPEMIELIGLLIEGGADVWIISESNPWSVRVAVDRLINPFLRKQRFRRITPDRIVGLTTGLYDHVGCLFTDTQLVRTDKEYRVLDPGRLSELTLGPRLAFPTSTFSGKAEVCRDLLPSPPVLAVGDSFSDLAMLGAAELKLLVARPGRSGLTSYIENRARSERGWMIQCVDPSPDGQMLA